ncbi:hypothetical protein [Litoribacillus peritrichatus]|uniref:Uncharacterized protein n=1 Tax=Litoribacillus peritrichatus TaxID=718191 RepID=A0ABP7NDR1_9GAMM
MSKKIRNNVNIIQNTSGIIAAIGLDKVGRGTLGNLITPATWLLNYKVQGNTPSAVDVGIYASGFLSAFAGAAVSTLKAYMDDDINKKVYAISQQQEPKFQPFILPVQNYGVNPPFIEAITIASHGGTTWQGKNGQWVYIVDAKGNLVLDFNPLDAVKVYRPDFPLVKSSDGKFNYSSY